MAPTDPLFAVLAVCLALALVHCCRRILPAPPAGARFAAVDGLRGYLALFVFLHHAAIWHQFLATRHWAVPPSRLFTHFGESSVALFFMITAFLFSRKVMAARAGFAWTGFYVARLLRLAPAHLLAMVLMFAVIGVETGWTLHESRRAVAWEAAQWLAFALPGYGNLNGFGATQLVTAGVVWSLACEWHFYLALPLVALALQRPAGAPACMIGVASVALAAWKHTHLAPMLAFLGGAAAAWLVDRGPVRRLATSRAGDAAAIACLAGAVTLAPTAYAPLPLLLLSLAFALIAAGSSLFGGLTSRVSRVLGEPTYSIYLLHGPLLYLGIRWVVGEAALAACSPTAYCAGVLLLLPVLLALSFASFRWVESPALRLARRLAGHKIKFPNISIRFYRKIGS